MKLLHIICLFANLQKQINYSSNWKIKTVEYFKAMNALLLYMIFFIQMQSLIVSRDHLHQYLFSLTIVSVSSKSDETVQCMFSSNQACRQ